VLDEIRSLWSTKAFPVFLFRGGWCGGEEGFRTLPFFAVFSSRSSVVVCFFLRCLSRSSFLLSLCLSRALLLARETLLVRIGYASTLNPTFVSLSIIITPEAQRALVIAHAQPRAPSHIVVRESPETRP